MTNPYRWRCEAGTLKLEFYTCNGHFIVIRQSELIGIALLIAVGDTENQVAHRRVYNVRLFCVYLIMPRSKQKDIWTSANVILFE